MPTTKPRIYPTLSPVDDARLNAVAEKLALTRPAVMRKALRELSKRELKP